MMSIVTTATIITTTIITTTTITTIITIVLSSSFFKHFIKHLLCTQLFPWPPKELSYQLSGEAPFSQSTLAIQAWASSICLTQKLH
jgi:hypothetical protein